MSTNRPVGVRELKLYAPRLVGRAAGGERIVISRYGKPRAVLGPFEEIPRTEEEQGPRMEEWIEDKRNFDRLLPALEKKHRGRYVALRGGRVVGFDADPERLFARVWDKLGGLTFFVGRVGGPPALVEMPGFEVEG
jgi:antitoxin (DNA-binding transcriptional repressor) of toxin-antitoxin stability system